MSWRNPYISLINPKDNVFPCNIQTIISTQDYERHGQCSSCGTLAARWILQWDWRTSLLFGTLTMVTGPTVINPLFRRLKVKRNISIVLEAEGVLINAVGAVVATVAMAVALSSSAGSRQKEQ